VPRASKKRPAARPPAAPPRRLELPGLRRLVPLALAVIVLVGLGLRAADLRADPPPDLSWSFAPWTDEGLNTYSARSLVLDGAWRTDDFFPFVVYPLFNLLVALAFRLFGVGFVSVKLVSLLAGLGSIVALYFLVRDAAGRLAGLIAALLLALCYPHVMYTRLGLVESLQVLFLLLAGLCWARGLERRWAMALAGLFAAGTVLLVKISALFIAPVMLAMLALLVAETRRDPARKAGIGRTVGLFLAGVGAAVAAWLAVVVLPHSRDYVTYVLRHSFESPAGHPADLAAYLFNTFTVGATSKLAGRLVFTALAGFLLLPGFGLSRSAGFRYLLAWFVFGLLMLGWMNYRPPRYEVILLPPLIAATAAGLARLVEQGTLLPALRAGWLRRLGWTLWLWPLATRLLITTSGFGGVFTPSSAGGAVAGGLGVAVVLAAASLGLARLLRSVPMRPAAGRLLLAGLFILLAFRLDLAQFSRWYSNRTHDMVRYSQELDRLLPDGAVLGGGWAPALLMGSRKRALCLTDWANNDDPVGRFGMTHLVSHEENDIRLLERDWPGLRERLRPVWQGRVRGTRLTVFELARPGE
jgi:4-amino-4-deoxy-L-arabinose transferase-like glycosyltransferase